MNKYLIIWLFVANLGDLATTYIAGIDREGNALIASMWGYWGFGALVLTKAVVCACCCISYKMLIACQGASGMKQIGGAADLIMIGWSAFSSLVVVWNLYAMSSWS